MTELMTLELHYPSNWAYEGEVDVLYCDPNNGAETSYGRLSQGQVMVRETYPGHRWVVRESTSRELLMNIVASRPGAGPHTVTIGSDGGLDPLKAAIWRMGRAPREVLLKANGVLLKLLQNILGNAAEPKYRSLRAANPAIAATIDVPGVIALLTCCGFEQTVESGEARLALAPGRPLPPLQDAVAQLQRLHNLMHGLPPPPESLSSMQQTASATAASSSAASSSAAAEPSHRCSACGGGIQNDLRRALAGSNEIGGWRSHNSFMQGEYRFHCETCNKDLCAKCYDQWKGGAAGVHPLQHSLSIVAPIENAWGGSSYGNSMPAPPPVTSRNRRGPFG
jgi:hypothetical protein|eukprot:Transcript_17392.p1 GENE.Transcript_17392~~Transcript_17392.p1  ORF type:complete len:337 (+),score=112.19 Transcript_17392:108-1118(+)